MRKLLSIIFDTLIVALLIAGCGTDGTKESEEEAPAPPPRPGFQDLLSQLKSKDPEERIAAIGQLKEIGLRKPGPVTEPLQNIIKFDPKPAVRKAAIDALKADKRSSLVDPLMEDLRSSETARLRASSEIALELVESVQAVDTEEQMLVEFGKKLAGEICSTTSETAERPVDPDRVTEILHEVRQGEVDSGAVARLNETLRTRTHKLGPNLRETLKKRLIKQQIESAEILSELGTDAWPAVPVLRETLSGNDNADIRAAAFRSLQRIDDLAGVGHLTLVFTKEDEKLETRIEALNRLGAMGPKLKRMSNVGQDIRNRSRGRQPNEGLKSVMDVGDEATSAMEKIGMAVSSGDPKIRQTALKALTIIDTESALSDLAQALKDPRLETRLFALENLKRRGPWASVALPELVEALGDKDSKVAGGAERILIDQVPKSAGVRELLKTLDNPDPEICRIGCRIIPEMDNSGEKSIPALTAALLSSKDAQIHRILADAMKKMFAQPEGIDERRIIEAAKEIIRKGKDIREVAMPFETLADSGNDREKLWAHAVLSVTAQDPAPHTKILLSDCESPDWWVRCDAIEALTLISKKDEIPQTVVQRLLEDPNPLVKQKLQ